MRPKDGQALAMRRAGREPPNPAASMCKHPGAGKSVAYPRACQGETEREAEEYRLGRGWLQATEVFLKVTGTKKTSIIPLKGDGRLQGGFCHSTMSLRTCPTPPATLSVGIVSPRAVQGHILTQVLRSRKGATEASPPCTTLMRTAHPSHTRPADIP